MQHNPRIYLIFWGPNWYTYSDTGTDLQADVQLDRMVEMFNGLAGSDYNNILSQYYDGDQNDPNTHIHNTTQLAGYIIDTTQPPLELIDSMMGSEAADASADPDLGWTNSPDTQFLVFPQRDSLYAGDLNKLCGEHGYGATTKDELTEYPNLIFGWVKYYPDPAMAAMDPPSICPTDLSVVASHEYAETATDPHADGSGWATDETFSWDWKEIGDLCNQVYANVDFAAVQKLWDNYANDCVSAHVNLSVVSDQGDPFTLVSGATGTAVLTYGHVGCTAVDSNGICTGGAWTQVQSAMPGAHWIWPTQLWDPVTQGGNAIKFSKGFYIPSTAVKVTGKIVIAADNFYVLQMNGQSVGRGMTWQQPDTYDLPPFLYPGGNLLTVQVANNPDDGDDPVGNPAGLIYRADIIYAIE